MNEETYKQVLEALKLAYRKHHLGDLNAGWSELSEKMGDALAEAMGDEEFIRWMQEIVGGEQR